MFSGLVASLLAALTIITPWWLTRGEFLTGLGLLAVSALYFWMTHATRETTWMLFLPKEGAVGVLFAIGTTAFVLLHHQRNLGGLLLNMVGFAILCFLNCALITRWERTQGDLHDRSSLINAFPELVSYLPAICGALTLIALMWSCFLWSANPLPLAASAALLGWLDHRRYNIHPSALRVLADFALLTPLLCVRL